MSALSNQRVAYFNGKIVPEREVVIPFPDAASRERFKLGAWEPGAIDGGTMKWDVKTRVLEVTATAKLVTIRRKKP